MNHIQTGLESWFINDLSLLWPRNALAPIKNSGNLAFCERILNSEAAHKSLSRVKVCLHFRYSFLGNPNTIQVKCCDFHKDIEHRLTIENLKYEASQVIKHRLQISVRDYKAAACLVATSC